MTSIKRLKKEKSTKQYDSYIFREEKKYREKI